MNKDEFARRVGACLIHVTLAENLPSIERYGLLRPSTVAARTGTGASDLALRDKAVLLAGGDLRVRLNHQRPLRAGRGQAVTFLEGHTLESWAHQLDQRLFFWPQRRGVAFAKSLKDRGEQTVLTLDSRAFFEAFADRIDLAPINTGSATRRASPRGDWIYVPALKGWNAFASNRLTRGLTTSRDTVVEVSLRTDIAPEILTKIRL